MKPAGLPPLPSATYTLHLRHLLMISLRLNLTDGLACRAKGISRFKIS
jgi:hypothetical protein